RLGGCPLRCRYCDTPGSLVPVPECRILGPDGERRRANPFTPVELEAEVQALVAAAPPLAALAVTGGEPLAQTDFLAAWPGISAATLERLHALASRRHPDVRVMPQLHKVLGIL